MLKLHNNLTKEKEPFAPIDPKNVRMYVCGMTVYDYCHLGHARGLVVFDVIYRHLCHIYGKSHVNYIRNITDIDDKIIKRANENGEQIGKLTARFIEAMHEDADALGVMRPNAEPRATMHMGEIIAMIQTLVEKGYAYVASNGDVYYDISQFDGYGALSGKEVDDLRAGARVNVGEAKDDPMDFVLWKAAKPEEPSWDSPWGPGRPGWHIECSAMSVRCLGPHFDIHGGGMDLQFPHHENEIAQSQAATGERFANVWLHNGMVRVNDEKMSKSLGNFFTIREVLSQYDTETVRYFLLYSHYRSPVNYTNEHLDSARASLATLYTALRELDLPPLEADLEGWKSAYEGDEFYQRFIGAMDDDFNTPEAIAVLFDLAHEINRLRVQNPEAANKYGLALRRFGGLLGILQREPMAFLQSGPGKTAAGELSTQEIERLIDERKQSRERKDWAAADRIRDELEAKGIVLEDGASGTLWRRK